jgi:hypothetical protein
VEEPWLRKGRDLSGTREKGKGKGRREELRVGVGVLSMTMTWLLRCKLGCVHGYCGRVACHDRTIMFNVSASEVPPELELELEHQQLVPPWHDDGACTLTALDIHHHHHLHLHLHLHATMSSSTAAYKDRQFLAVIGDEVLLRTYICLRLDAS